MEIFEFSLLAQPAKPTASEQIFEPFVFEAIATLKCWHWASMHSPKFSDCYFGFDRNPVELMFLPSSSGSFTTLAITFYWRSLKFHFPDLVIDQYRRQQSLF
jgi:hypothetical protein